MVGRHETLAWIFFFCKSQIAPLINIHFLSSILQVLSEEERSLLPSSSSSYVSPDAMAQKIGSMQRKEIGMKEKEEEIKSR
jgi:hypothetical protein